MTDELIERLEKATGPDRELDGRIWLAVDPEMWARKCSFIGKKYAGHTHTKAEKHAHEVNSGAIYSPAYTSSIDAALTLVPEGWCWHAGWNSGVAWNAKGTALISQHTVGGIHKGAIHATTPALALCIAALKARKAQP